MHHICPSQSQTIVCYALLYTQARYTVGLSFAQTKTYGIRYGIAIANHETMLRYVVHTINSWYETFLGYNGGPGDA